MALIDAGTGNFNNLSPFCDFRLNILAKVLGRCAHRFDPEAGEPLPAIRRLEKPVDFHTELVHDFLGRSSRSDHPKPRADLKARDASHHLSNVEYLTPTYTPVSDFFKPLDY